MIHPYPFLVFISCIGGRDGPTIPSRIGFGIIFGGTVGGTSGVGPIFPVGTIGGTAGGGPIGPGPGIPVGAPPEGGRVIGPGPGTPVGVPIGGNSSEGGP